MGPPLRPINRHNSHSKTILSVTERRRFIPRLRGEPAAPRGPAAHPSRRANQNRLKLPTFNHLRSKDHERPSREVLDHRAGRTSSSGRTYPMKIVPCAQLTSLTYKRSLTPAGLNIQCWSISFPLFCSLRVGLV
jgi:hypothetical protein